MESKRYQEVFGFKISDMNLEETTEYISNAIINKNKIVREDLNAHKLLLAYKTPDFAKILKSANIINPDGFSIVLASKLLQKPLKERVTGVDLMNSLFEKAETEQFKVYLWGAEQWVIEKCKLEVNERFGSKPIVGVKNGFFQKNDISKIIEEINSHNPDILFLGLPSPLKEEICYEFFDLLNCKLIMGVGGSFDVLAGKVNRAPRIYQKSGFEWLYRLLQEPRRMWKRYLFGNSEFIYLTIMEMINKKVSKRIHAI